MPKPRSVEAPTIPATGKVTAVVVVNPIAPRIPGADVLK